MEVNALLDVNVVAHETEDEVAVLLEVQAPTALVEVDRMQDYGDAGGVASAPYLSKMTRESYHRGSRKRGRGPDAGS